MDMIRSRGYTHGNTTFQMNSQHGGGGGGGEAGLLIVILVIAVGLVALSPFALPIWLMFCTAEIMNILGVHPMVGIGVVAGVFFGIAVLLLLFRPLRYVYIVLNAILIAMLVYNYLLVPDSHN